jgi:hypothetical protein
MRFPEPDFNIQKNKDENAFKSKEPCNAVIPFFFYRKEPREKHDNNCSDKKSNVIHADNYNIVVQRHNSTKAQWLKS